ncbi:ATP-dependent DNA ligase, partial [Rhizobium johnstonii]
TESILVAFDLLYLDGHDLTGTELEVLRHLLEDLIPEGDDRAIRLSEEIELPSEELLEHACHQIVSIEIEKVEGDEDRLGRYSLAAP